MGDVSQYMMNRGIIGITHTLSRDAESELLLPVLRGQRIRVQGFENGGNSGGKEAYKIRGSVTCSGVKITERII